MTSYQSQFMQNLPAAEEEGGPRAQSRFMGRLDKLLAKGPAPLRDRIRETFGRDENDEVADLLREKAAEMRYGQGVEAVPIFRHKAKGEQVTQTTAGKTVRPGGEIEQISVEPGGVPVGIRLSTPQGPRDIMIEQDESLAAAVETIRGKRMALLEELRESGQELGFFERLAPGVKTTHQGYVSKLRNAYGDDNVIEVGDPDEHVIVLREGEPPALADIKGFMQGSLAGDVADVTADIGEGVLGSVLAYFIARRGGAAAPAAAGTDMAANIARQGVSAAVGGEDYPGQTLTESLPERAGQAILTGAAGAAGDVVGRKFIGPLAKKTSVLAKSRFAKKLADTTKEEVSALTSGTRVGEFLQQSREVEREISEIIGKEARFSTGQATGSEAMLGGEFSLAGTSARPRVIAEQRQRLADGAAAMDAFVKMTSDNPGLLGDAAVGRGLADAAEQVVDSLKSQRSTYATPLYEEVEKTVGNLFPNRPMIAEAGNIAAEFERVSGITSKVTKAIDFLDDRATNGMLSILDLNQERKYWSKVAGGQIHLGGQEMSKAQSKALGARMLGAFDTSMEWAGVGRTLAANAAGRLKQANLIWTKYSQAIDGFLGKQKGSNKLGLVGKLMAMSAEARDADIIKTLRKAPPQQVAGMLDTISKLPDGERVARQTKAQLVKSVFEAGGHKGGQGTIIGERVSRQLPPKMLADAIEGHDPLLQAIYANDPASKNKLRAIGRWFDRIAQGPQVPGTQEAPGYADMNIAQALTRLQGIQEIATQKVIAAARAIPEKVLSIKGWARLTDDQAAALAATPAGVDAMHELAKAQANPFRARAAQRATRAWAHMLAILEREDLLEEFRE